MQTLVARVYSHFVVVVVVVTVVVEAGDRSVGAEGNRRATLVCNGQSIGADVRDSRLVGKRAVSGYFWVVFIGFGLFWLFCV